MSHNNCPQLLIQNKILHHCHSRRCRNYACNIVHLYYISSRSSVLFLSVSKCWLHSRHPRICYLFFGTFLPFKLLDQHVTADERADGTCRVDLCDAYGKAKSASRTHHILCNKSLKCLYSHYTS